MHLVLTAAPIARKECQLEMPRCIENEVNCIDCSRIFRIFSLLHSKFVFEIFTGHTETLTFASFSAAAHREIIHNSKEPTFFTRNDLLGYYVMANGAKTHYLNELVNR